ANHLTDAGGSAVVRWIAFAQLLRPADFFLVAMRDNSLSYLAVGLNEIDRAPVRHRTNSESGNRVEGCLVVERRGEDATGITEQFRALEYVLQLVLRYDGAVARLLRCAGRAVQFVVSSTQIISCRLELRGLRFHLSRLKLEVVGLAAEVLVCSVQLTIRIIAFPDCRCEC